MKGGRNLARRSEPCSNLRRGKRKQMNSNLKSLIAAIAITLALAGSVACGPSQAQREADLNAELQRQNAETEAQFFNTLLEMVAQDQGEAIGLSLLDCGRGGYSVHVSQFPLIGYAKESPKTMSNRWKAQCDSIIKTENRIVIARNAREKAEEKRKDDAYDKAH